MRELDLFPTSAHKNQPNTGRWEVQSTKFLVISSLHSIICSYLNTCILYNVEGAFLLERQLVACPGIRDK
jgi:hypothetical protein